MTDTLQCPSCRGRVESINGGFLERGPHVDEISDDAREFLQIFGNEGYADEQSVNGYRCRSCGMAFCTGDLSEYYDKPLQWDAVTKAELDKEFPSGPVMSS